MKTLSIVHKRFLILTLLLSLVTLTYAQNISVSISGDKIAGKEIQLSCITDRISLAEQTIATIHNNEYSTNANFSFSFDGTRESILKIDNREFHFLATPGNKYFINILPYNDSVFSFAMKEVLPCEMTMEKEDKINYPIEDVDTLLNNFIADNYRLLYIKDSSTIAKLNKLEKDLILKYTTNEYLSNYVKYEFASLRYGLYIGSRLKVKEELFKDSKVLYDNIGYMDCFNTVFNHYFSQGYKYISQMDMEKWLDAGNYSAFNDALGRDSILKNEVFREIVFLQGMKDAFLDGIFERTRILNMIEKFEKQTKFDNHQKIATNLRKYLTERDFGGKKINDLKVKNIEGETISLLDFNDKPLVLCLIQLDCTACLKELETIHFYYDSIKENSNVVVISFDNTFEKMYNFVKNSKTGSKYQFPFVHFDYNWQLTQEYKLHFFPTFVLINMDGTIRRNPMESPSQGSLKQFMNKKQK